MLTDLQLTFCDVKHPLKCFGTTLEIYDGLLEDYGYCSQEACRVISMKRQLFVNELNKVCVGLFYFRVQLRSHQAPISEFKPPLAVKNLCRRA